MVNAGLKSLHLFSVMGWQILGSCGHSWGTRRDSQQQVTRKNKSTKSPGSWLHRLVVCKLFRDRESDRMAKCKERHLYEKIKWGRLGAGFGFDHTTETMFEGLVCFSQNDQKWISFFGRSGDKGVVWWSGMWGDGGLGR